MKAEIKSKRVRAIIEELKYQYMEANKNCRPWIIGFSGGKHSTVLWFSVFYLHITNYTKLPQHRSFDAGALSISYR